MNRRRIKTIATYFRGIQGDGTGRVMVTLSKLWIEMGYSVIVITEEQPSPDDYSLPDDAVRVVISGTSNEYSETAKRIREAELKEIIERNSIDLFIDNYYYSPLLPCNADIVHSCHALYFVYLHNSFLSFLINLNGLLDNKAIWLSTAQLNTDESVCERLDWYKQCDRVIVLSKADERLLSHFGVDALFIPNPCENETHAFNRFKNNSILWVGRLATQKKPLEAIKAFKLIKKRLPDATLTFVGTGYLEKDAKKFAEGIDGISFVGFQRDIESFYQNADILISTSEYEGWPLTLNEAKACGLPIAAYDLPYLEVFKDGRGIVAVPQGDAEALAEAVIGVLTDNETRERLSREGIESFKELASFDFDGAWRELFDRVSEGLPVRDPESSDEDDRRNDDIIIRSLVMNHDIGMQYAYDELKELRPLAIKGNSTTYRVGEKLMWLPKKLYGLLKKRGE